MTCECCDTLCPAHPGHQCGAQATQTLYRVDRVDFTGVELCDDCAADAFDPDIYTDEHPHHRNDSDGDLSEEADDA